MVKTMNLESMVRALADNYAFNEQTGKLAELETVLRQLATHVGEERYRIVKLQDRRMPRSPNDDAANPSPVKSDFNCSAGGGTRVIRSGKEMT